MREPIVSPGFLNRLRGNMTTFKNESDLQFTNISSEKERTYQFPNGQTYTIKHPQYLNVSPSGGHRIFDGRYCYYIQPKEGWVIRWETGVNKPHFVR